MSMNQMRYDNCSYKSELNESISVSSYIFDATKFNHCQKCRPELGLLGGTAVSQPMANLVDVENNLFGIDRPATKCPSYKWLPTDGKSVQGKEYIKPVCHPQLNTQMQHLQSCQLNPYHSTPQAPNMNLFKCQQ